MYSTSFYDANQAYGYQKLSCIKMGHSFVALLTLLILPSTLASIEIVDSYDRVVDTYVTIEATAIEETHQGYIELANPPDACVSISPSNLPNNSTMDKLVSTLLPSNATMQKFVLINGTSECDFKTKVENAAAAGYDVVVMHNPFVTPFEYPNITFPLSHGQVNVSVVLVLCEDGIMIRENYLYDKSKKEVNFIIKVSPNYFNRWLLDYLFFTLLLVAIGVCFAAALLILCKVYSMCRACCRGDEEESDSESETAEDVLPRRFADLRTFVRAVENAANEKSKMRWKRVSRVLKRHPSVRYTEGYSPFDTCCSICFEEFEVGKWVRKLDCNHVFHNYCIDKWLWNPNSRCQDACPDCKGPVDLENSVEEPTDTTPLLSSSCGATFYGSPNLLESDDFLAQSRGSVNN